MLKIKFKKKKALNKKLALEKARLRILKRMQQHSASPVPIIEKKEKKKVENKIDTNINLSEKKEKPSDVKPAIAPSSQSNKSVKLSTAKKKIVRVKPVSLASSQTTKAVKSNKSKKKALSVTFVNSDSASSNEKKNKINIKRNSNSSKKKAKTKTVENKIEVKLDKNNKLLKKKVKKKEQQKTTLVSKKQYIKKLKIKKFLSPKIKYNPQKVKLFSHTKAYYSLKKLKKVKRMSRRFYFVKKNFRFDLFYNFLFFKKVVTSVLVKGLKKKTKTTIFKSFIYLKKNKKLSFLVFLKLIILLRVPLYFKPVYRSGELFTVPVPLSYLKQWFMCFKLLKKLEKSVRFGSFLNKLEGEYSYLYNDIFLNLPKIRRNIIAKKKKFSPFKLKKKVMPSSFLLHLFLSKNAAILDNSSYFHYRW